MDYIRVTVCTTSQGVEPVTGRLYRLGIQGVQIEDKEEIAHYLEENRQCWGGVDTDILKNMDSRTKVIAYIQKNAGGRELLTELRGSMEQLHKFDAGGEFGSLEIEFSDVSEQDWANNWKRYFKPLKIGKKILIQPEWEKLPEDVGDRIVFSVDPGMTFGTGGHETTRMCIEEAERCINPGCSVLDLGCGSGILAIISMLLGAKDALGVDIDPNSAKVAGQNARRNGIGAGRFNVLTGDLTADAPLRERIGKGKYDIVYANIIADVIIALAPYIPDMIAPGGMLIASGIIDERRDEVAQALIENGLSLVRENRGGGWRCLCCKIRP